MSGYAATARIDRVRPRLVMAPTSPDFVAFGRVRRAERPQVLEAGTELAETEVHDTLLDRLQAARDRWTQLTFYLLDPNGWR